jgi:hypothetical protein
MLENTEKSKFEINFVNHECLLKIKTGYIQTDEGGVNTQYKSNKKNKRWELMRLIFMDGLCVSLLYRNELIESKTNMQYILKIICILQSLYTGRTILKG